MESWRQHGRNYRNLMDDNLYIPSTDIPAPLDGNTFTGVRVFFTSNRSSLLVSIYQYDLVKDVGRRPPWVTAPGSTTRRLFYTKKKTSLPARTYLFYLIPGADAVVCPPSPYVQRPERSSEQSRLHPHLRRRHLPPMEPPPRASNSHHPPLVLLRPSKKRLLAPRLAQSLLPFHQHSKRDTLRREAVARVAAAPLRLHALHRVRS